MLGILRPGGLLTMPDWFLLVDALTGVPRNDWEKFAGPTWADEALDYSTNNAGSRPSCNRSLIDADVAPAEGRVRFTVPTSPSLAESKAGNASHEVELRRVCQAQADRVQDEAVGPDANVVLVEDLRDGVVSANVQHDMVDPDVLGVDELVAWP
jgi:hypothetical protein